MEDKTISADTIVTRFEDVKKQTTEEYFEGNQFSIHAFKKKYAIQSDETYVQALKRVCDYIASVESTQELREYWSSRWFDEIYNDWWHPAGSIMQGAGSGRKISLANCTTISLGRLRNKDEEWDSLEAIVRNTGYTVSKCAAFRQGLGVDFSALRPAGTKVLNSANESTGAVHWMGFMDGIGRFVGQKGRIPAMLFSLCCDHPDIEAFCVAKEKRDRIQNANISVQCTEKFYRAVANNEEWELKFEIPAVKKGDKIYVDVHSIDMSTTREKETGRYYRLATHDRKREVWTKTVKARELMELIAKQMHANGEPGIQNIDLARKYSNSDAMYDPNDEYDSRILSTNACSEQYLSRESLCVLASINVARFSSKREIYIGQLEKIGKSINRFLDNVNECEVRDQTYATPHQKLAIQKLRRTGAGVTNIAAWLFKQNVTYASTACNNVIEDFMKWYNYWLYVSTEELGKEKGSFGLFKSDKWQAAPFVSRMMKLSEELHKEFGVPVLTGKHARNVTVSSIAPTGTLSLMFRGLVLSYGIEPPFFMYFWKRTRMAGKYDYYFNVPRIVREMFDAKGHKIPIESDSIQDTWDGAKGKEIAKFIDSHRNEFKFLESTDVKPMDKLEMMSRVMKWVDSSISTTYMLPEGSDWKEVYKFIVASHEKEVKSIAAFPDRKMYGIVTKIPFKELAFKLKEEGLGMYPSDFTDEERKELNLASENISRVNEAPKRLESLDADIYVVSVKGEKFVMVVGLQNGEPYEIFGGHVNGFGFKFQQKRGKISKVKKGQYALEIDELVIEDFSKQFTPTEQILFRMTSTALRHGVPIPFVVEQLQKATQDITSMGSAASRVLKKYIKNGQSVSGKKCPSCGKDLVYIDGCVSCSGCGWSQCS